jgi:hypothetical protein
MQQKAHHVTEYQNRLKQGPGQATAYLRDNQLKSYQISRWRAAFTKRRSARDNSSPPSERDVSNRSFPPEYRHWFLTEYDRLKTLGGAQATAFRKENKLSSGLLYYWRRLRDQRSLTGPSQRDVPVEAGTDQDVSIESASAAPPDAIEVPVEEPTLDDPGPGLTMQQKAHHVTEYQSRLKQGPGRAAAYLRDNQLKRYQIYRWGTALAKGKSTGGATSSGAAPAPRRSFTQQQKLDLYNEYKEVVKRGRGEGAAWLASHRMNSSMIVEWGRSLGVGESAEGGSSSGGTFIPRRSFAPQEKIDHVTRYRELARSGKGSAYLAENNLHYSTVDGWGRAMDKGKLTSSTPHLTWEQKFDHVDRYEESLKQSIGQGRVYLEENGLTGEEIRRWRRIRTGVGSRGALREGGLPPVSE